MLDIMENILIYILLLSFMFCSSVLFVCLYHLCTKLDTSINITSTGSETSTMAATNPIYFGDSRLSSALVSFLLQLDRADFRSRRSPSLHTVSFAIKVMLSVGNLLCWTDDSDVVTDCIWVGVVATHGCDVVAVLL